MPNQIRREERASALFKTVHPHGKSLTGTSVPGVPYRVEALPHLLIFAFAED